MPLWLLGTTPFQIFKFADHLSLMLCHLQNSLARSSRGGPRNGFNFQDFEKSVREIIEACADDDQELPVELKNLTFEYRYDLASLFDYYRIINVSQFAKSAGINPSLMRQYKSGQYISEKQVLKIEKELNRIGKELANLSLI